MAPRGEIGLTGQRPSVNWDPATNSMLLRNCLIPWASSFSYKMGTAPTLLGCPAWTIGPGAVVMAFKSNGIAIVMTRNPDDKTRSSE